uniref:Glycosyltransferase n=1 Tax=Eucommia ulmoides TaxID=4392 RepID=A0A023SFS7_EUCUL|nr:glucosyltransferase [Eucommia ulmoides]
MEETTMTNTNRVELVFIPSPGMGHLVSAVEMAKLLVDRDQRLSITLLIMKAPFKTKANYSPAQSLSTAAASRIRFVDLPGDELESDAKFSPHTFLSGFISGQKTLVRDAVAQISSSPEAPRLAGFFIDMFCTSMIDVADEFRVPTYVFFTSGAAFLGLVFHLQTMRDDHNHDVTELKDSDADLLVPCFVKSVPTKVLPSVVLDKEGGSEMFHDLVRRIRETKGILINTFSELESHAIHSINTPPVYPVGPILNVAGDNDNESTSAAAILKWLDDQPPSSVVFLCFGSMGCFGVDQVNEIAHALERSGHRFLWSLRRPPPEGKLEFPGDYTNLEEVLPERFLERTAEIGRVIGWAPQAAVLAHRAVGGFVSHCGWNSTLESVWYGVPMAAWPQYAEQQLNAFLMVEELEMAVEIKMDYRNGFYSKSGVALRSEEIEKGIRRLMECGENGMRKKVEEMREKSRVAVREGGSSYLSIGRLIEDVMKIVEQ